MLSEEKIIIAFIFKRSGKNMLKESEIYLPLSIELGWFTTQQAQEFVKHALKQGILMKKDNIIIPAFDIEKIHIPIGFHPSKKDYTTALTEKKDKKEKEEEKMLLIDKIIDHIAEKTEKDREDISAEIKNIEDKKNILPEVAALLVGWNHNIDMEKFFDLVENRIFK